MTYARSPSRRRSRPSATSRSRTWSWTGTPVAGAKYLRGAGRDATPTSPWAGRSSSRQARHPGEPATPPTVSYDNSAVLLAGARGRRQAGQATPVERGAVERSTRTWPDAPALRRSRPSPASRPWARRCTSSGSPCRARVGVRGAGGQPARTSPSAPSRSCRTAGTTYVPWDVRDQPDRRRYTSLPAATRPVAPAVGRDRRTGGCGRWTGRYSEAGWRRGRPGPVLPHRRSFHLPAR